MPRGKFCNSAITEADLIRSEKEKKNSSEEQCLTLFNDNQAQVISNQPLAPSTALS